MKAKQIAVTSVFLGLLLIIAAAFFILPDTDISVSERRHLTQFETYAEQKDAQGEDYGIADYFAYLERYALDQFPARDAFRTLKAVFKRDILRQMDTNGYYEVGGSLSRVDAALSDKAVADAVSRLNDVYTLYFKTLGANAYYALVPDKNYFLAASSGHLCYDYEALYASVRGMLNADIAEIDLLGTLEIDDYYRTDPHWDQSQILPAADVLLAAMGAQRSASEHSWTVHTLSPFYGTYYGQSALPVEPDTLTYLTSDAIDGITVLNHANGETTVVYDEADFYNVDPYDLFLGGAVPLLTLRNPNQDNGRQLVVFRDSFGGSMVPLLAGEYSEIIVVDIRYISPRQLSMLRFRRGCDVLFLYSTSVLNSPGVFAN